MVSGFTKFKERFQGFENQYVIIGGTACDFRAKGFDARKISNRVNAVVPVSYTHLDVYKRQCLTGAIWLALLFSTVISALLFAFLNHFFNLPGSIPVLGWLLIFNTLIAGLIDVYKRQGNNCVYFFPQEYISFHLQSNIYQAFYPSFSTVSTDWPCLLYTSKISLRNFLHCFTKSGNWFQ